MQQVGRVYRVAKDEMNLLNQQDMDTLSRALEQAERDKRRQASERTRKPAPQQNTTPSKVIRLEYPGGSVNVNVRNGDENKLLRALKESGIPDHRP